jgi:hypothetical protein
MSGSGGNEQWLGEKRKLMHVDGHMLCALGL